MCTIEDYKHLAMDSVHWNLVVTELDAWHNSYLPINRFYSGPSTILDVGAGCGETAQFYLKHGAGRVICIEGNERALEYLRKNFGSDPRVVIVPAMLDSIKIDVDGAEDGMVFETHYASEFKQVWQDGNSETRTWRVTKR